MVEDVGEGLGTPLRVRKERADANCAARWDGVGETYILSVFGDGRRCCDTAVAGQVEEVVVRGCWLRTLKIADMPRTLCRERLSAHVTSKLHFLSARGVSSTLHENG